MEDMEPERRIGRRKRKLSTRQGVVIGVATVAGLGLLSKLVSFLRRDKPKKLMDGDIETLEAVLSGDAAKGALPPQAEVHFFANLDNDEPDHEVVNGQEVSPPRSKDADSVSEATKEDDVTEDGEMRVSQGLVGETNSLTIEESEQAPVSQERVNVPHSNGEEVEGKQRNELHIENEGKHQVGDAVELHDEDEGKDNGDDAVAELQIEEKGKPHIEDADLLHTEDEEKHHNEDAVELQTENKEKLRTEDEEKPHSGEALEQLIEDAEKLETKDEGKHLSVEQSSVDAVERPSTDEDAGELQTEDSGEAL